MWASLSWRAIWTGLAAGALLAAVIFGVGYLATVSLKTGPARGVILVGSVLLGLFAGGWVAGRMALHSGRFHGSLTGLGLALLVVVIARMGGSPAPTSSVLILAALAILLGGIGGWLAGSRR